MANFSKFPEIEFSNQFFNDFQNKILGKIYFGTLFWTEIAFWRLRDSNGILDFGVDFLFFKTFSVIIFNNFLNKFWE